MTGRLFRAALVGLTLAAVAAVLARFVQPLAPGARTVPATVSSVLLVVLAVGTWWAPWLARRALQRDRTVTALRDQAVRFTATAAGATGLAFLGALYLAGYRLVDGGGLVVSLVALLAFIAPPYIWTVQYYRRR